MSELRLEWIDPKTLTPNPANWRRHPKAQRDALEAVIADVGWAGALLYNEKTGNLIDGHLRQEIDHDGPVPVLIGSWTEEQERLILATLDPIAALAATDSSALDALLKTVETESEAVEALLEGLAEREGLNLGGEPVADPGAQMDRAAELQEKWGTETGQLWRLGENRLFVGSASEAGIKCDLAVYDPPFDWSASQQDMALSWTRWKVAVLLGLHYCMPLAARHDYRHWWIWDSATGKFGGKGHHPTKTCAIALCFGEKEYWYPEQAISILVGNDVTNVAYPPQVVRIVRPIARGKSGHVEEKPLLLADYIILLYSKRGDLIGDPFAGSGTFLMSAEKLGRKYWGSENDPGNAAVILERYITTFGVAPVCAPS